MLLCIGFKRARIAQGELRHLHEAATHLNGINLNLEVGVRLSDLLIRREVHLIEIEVGQDGVIHILAVIDKHPIIAVSLHICLVFGIHSIDFPVAPVAASPPCIVVTGHQAIVGGSHRTCGLEDDEERCPLGQAVAPLGLVVTVEHLGQSFVVAIVTVTVQHEVIDGAVIVELVAGAPTKLAHLLPDIGGRHSGVEYHHEIGIGLRDILRASEIDGLVVYGRHHFVLLLIHQHPSAGIPQGSVIRSKVGSIDAPRLPITLRKALCVVTDNQAVVLRHDGLVRLKDHVGICGTCLVAMSPFSQDITIDQFGIAFITRSARAT